MEFEGYCVKCREKRSVDNGEVKDTPNGRQMAQGKCPVCGTTVTRFMAGGGGKSAEGSKSGGSAKAGEAKGGGAKAGGAKAGSEGKGKATESASGKSGRSNK